jgi:RNA polymerase sigma-70 factor (ECF subfamily)
MRSVPRAAKAAPRPEPATDEELLVAAGRGDEGAFAALYDRVAPAVYGLVRRVVKDPSMTEEVCQEVLVDAWRTAPRYDPGRAPARGWMLVLAHRRAVDVVRSEQRHRERTQRVASRAVTPEAGADVPALANVERGRVRAALAELTELQRTSIELAYYDGLSQSQIADALQLPLGTVKTRVRDGLIRLRDALAVSDE